MTISNIANVLLFLMMSGWTAYSPDISEMSRCSNDDVIYTVQEGDNLHTISGGFGSYLFWESIYIANADQVRNPDLIYPGQEIKIPYNVASYTESDLTKSQVLKNPFCKITELPYTKVEEKFLSRYSLTHLLREAGSEKEQEGIESELVNQKGQENQEKTITTEERAKLTENFKRAFNAVIQEKQNREEKHKTEKKQRESERQMLMEIDGMVHDETRSKVGRDFYDVFYSYWQSPPEANNFTIRIAEQPSPNLGTTIYVTVNYNETFRMRLQPRYEMIQEAGKYAVKQTYSHLQNNPQKNIIY